MADPFRILNAAGRERWATWVGELRDDPTLDPPRALLTDAISSREIVGELPLPSGPFASKYEFATALLPIIEAIEAQRLPEADWAAVWDTLALIYFDEICPAENGKRKPKAHERYRFTSNFLKSHRHRVAGPISFLRFGGANARLFSDGAPSKLSDQEEQIGARQEMAGNPELLALMLSLYWDEDKSGPKKGWAPNSPKPGTLRRLVTVYSQLSRTFDLGTISSASLRDLLPREFMRWLA